MPQTPAPALASATAVLLVLTGAMAPPDAQAEGVFPPQHLLKDYARRLLQAPDCGSRCYAINAAHLEATQDSLDLLLTISVVERIGVPLPRFSPSWQLSAIRIGDAPAQQLFQHEGQWFVLLGPGVHDVQLRGRLVGEEFKLDFPEAHNITVEAPGWEVTGLAGNRLQNKSLTLSRQLASQQRDTLFPDPIAPQIAVCRSISPLLSSSIVRLADFANVAGATALPRAFLLAAGRAVGFAAVVPRRAFTGLLFLTFASPFDFRLSRLVFVTGIVLPPNPQRTASNGQPAPQSHRNL